jgi:hypothetical protein
VSRTVLKNLALLGAAVVVCLVGAELFFRVWPQFLDEEASLRLHWRELRADVRNQAMTLPDPYLGFLYRPHITRQISRHELNFTFTTDEKGFRNPSPWPERADIVVVGDSMAFGYGVDDEQAWVKLVADDLPETTIVNLGLIGAGPQQYLRVLESYGLDLDPKLVLFMLFPGNDLSDAETFRQWLDAGTSASYEDWRIRRGQPDARDPLHVVLERSYLVEFLHSVRRSLTSPVAASTIELDDGRLQLTPELYASSMEKARPGHPVFEMIMASIKEARAVSSRGGSEFLVLLMPAKEEVYLPLLHEKPPPATAPFAARFEEDGIPYLDLTPPFRAKAREGARLFFEVDGHPNEAGCRLIAEVVLDHLRSSAPGLIRAPLDNGTQEHAGGDPRAEAMVQPAELLTQPLAR